MAVSGHNGNNETLIGLSNAIGLTFYNENATEIKITKAIVPIDIRIPRDTISLSYYEVNATKIEFLSKQNFLTNVFNITAKNASLHIELKPTSFSIGYLLVLKLGNVPIINATHADFTSFRIFCPSNSIEKKFKKIKFYFQKYFFFQKQS